MPRTDDGLLVLGPGEGDAFPSLDAVRKASAEDGDGRWGAAVIRGLPGEGGRTHRHVGSAEGFFMLEGEVELLGATSTTPLRPGAFVLVPPDTEHGIRIVGTEPAAWLAIWPAELDGYPEALEQLRRDDARPAEITTLRRRHGIEPGRQR